MSKNNIRKLKCSGDCIENNESTLHPLTLQKIINNTNKNICPINTFTKIPHKDCNKDDNNLKSLIQHMEVPYINIEAHDLISFYNINTIDDLEEWITNNYKNKPFDNVNRVISLWIKANINDLKNFNFGLVSIIKKVLIFYDKEIKEKYIDNELSNYVDYWIKKVVEDSFEFNLIYDFKKYLSKKYDK